MVFAGILASESSPLILKSTNVLEGMVVVAFRDLPSQLLEPRLYILTVTCEVEKRDISRNIRKWEFDVSSNFMGFSEDTTWVHDL